MLMGYILFGYVKEPLNPVFRSTGPQTPTSKILLYVVWHQSWANQDYGTILAASARGAEAARIDTRQPVVKIAIALVSCNPEQRGNEAVELAVAKNRQKGLCTTPF
jgi:hypothetical protein